MASNSELGKPQSSGAGPIAQRSAARVVVRTALIVFLVLIGLSLAVMLIAALIKRRNEIRA